MDKTKNKKQQDQDMLHRVREDTDAALRDIYNLYRNTFISWSTHSFNLDESTARDIFQEVIIAFYKNVITLKLHTLEASLKSYLFTIGKYKIINRYQKKQREKATLFDDFSHLVLSGWDLATSDISEKSIAEEKLVATLELLGDKCKQILRMFYFENRSHTEIVNHMGYNTTEVSRTMKKKCIKRLKKLLTENK